MPVSQGSKTIRLPPGVVTTKVEWPNQVIASADMPASIKLKGWRPPPSISFAAARSVRARRAAPRAQARLAEGARAWLRELPPPQGTDARARPAHRLRRSELPQHRRVLAPRHRHLHDPRRHLHALVRLLQRHARHAARAPTSRNRSRSPAPSTPSSSTTSSSRRSIATTCPTSARRSSRGRSPRRARAFRRAGSKC